MNGCRAALDALREIAQVAARGKRTEVGLALPATLIAQASTKYRRLAIGAQDVHADEGGAFTGSLSATMLKDAGATFTIVGHSECRRRYGESDQEVRRKAEAARRAGLDVILCVGESASVRAKGCAVETVTEQLGRCLPDGADGSWFTIAYEPIWAIGTGFIPTLNDIVQMHEALRTYCRARFGSAGHAIRLLYGGSVTAENAAQFMAIPEVDGVLVGGASLAAATFAPIIDPAANVTAHLGASRVGRTSLGLEL